MSIYRLSPKVGDEFAALVLASDLNSHDQFRFAGKAADGWEPITLRWSEVGQRPSDELVTNDVVHVFGAAMDIAVNEKAKQRLQKVFQDQVEFLPVSVMGSGAVSWYLVNVLNIIEKALDERLSVFKKLRNGNLGPVKKAVFDVDCIPMNSIFVYPSTYMNFMFRGDELRESLQSLGLTGLDVQACVTNESLDSVG